MQTRQFVVVDWLLSWCLAPPLEMEYLREHIDIRLMLQSGVMTLHHDSHTPSWKHCNVKTQPKRFGGYLKVILLFYLIAFSLQLQSHKGSVL